MPGAACLAGGTHGLGRHPPCFAVWWSVTQRRAGRRNHFAVEGAVHPRGAFSTFPSLWFDRALPQSLTTLRRLALGFGLAALVGCLWGCFCGCFPRVQAFFMPMPLFGGNIPVAADSLDLFPVWHRRAPKGCIHLHRLRGLRGLGHMRAVQEVGSEYIDTAYTLGREPGRPSARCCFRCSTQCVQLTTLIFGLAFGYIMLAEVVKFGGQTGGLGDSSISSTARTPRARDPDPSDHPDPRPGH